MWNLLLNSVLPTLGTVAVGALGWAAANFVGRQILSFYKLRGEIHEELCFTDNVSLAIFGKEKCEKARDDLRRLATRLSALYVSSTWPTRKFLGWRGYDLATASAALIGTSNTIDRSDHSITLHRYKLERALQLPLSLPETDVKQIAAQIAGGRR